MLETTDEMDRPLYHYRGSGSLYYKYEIIDCGLKIEYNGTNYYVHFIGITYLKT